MIDIAKNFFDDNDLIISMNLENPDKSKTKCIAFGMKSDPLPLYIDENPIPWTNKYTHLGHVLCKDGTSTEDILFKKRLFIGKYHSLCQLLKQKDPQVYMRLINVYLCDFYGSNLWSLFGKSVDQMYTTWNNMIRFVFKLPLQCHRYLIEPLSCNPHLKTQLINRFMNFYKSLYNSNRFIVQNLLSCQESDYRSDFGSNILNILSSTKETNILSVNKNSYMYMPVEYSVSLCLRIFHGKDPSHTTLVLPLMS